jgi:hypothetical protein
MEAATFLLELKRRLVSGPPADPLDAARACLNAYGRRPKRKGYDASSSSLRQGKE